MLTQCGRVHDRHLSARHGDGGAELLITLGGVTNVRTAFNPAPRLSVRGPVPLRSISPWISDPDMSVRIGLAPRMKMPSPDLPNPRNRNSSRRNSGRWSGSRSDGAAVEDLRIRGADEQATVPELIMFELDLPS